MTFEIPDAMVEAAAKRRWEETWRHDDTASDSFGEMDLGPWEEVEPEVQDRWLEQARADLAAALGVCTVKEEWVVTGEPGPNYPSYAHRFGDKIMATDFVLTARRHPWATGPDLHQRLVVDAPPAIATQSGRE